jgi:hypothetical protein
VTDDGSSWVSLENTNQSDRSWLYRQFELSDYVDMTNQVRIRYNAEDAGSGSIVEAGVDDFLLVAFSMPTDTEAPTVTVLDPNGGEAIPGGGPTPYIIRWDAEDNMGISATKILLSTDGGVTFPDTIANGVFDSTFSWDVPGVDEPNCRIKIIVKDGASNEAWDVSDQNFAITTGTAVAEGDLRVPGEVTLEQNRPNPFNPATEVIFGVPEPMKIALRVYSVEGRLVATLAEGAFGAGYHSATWYGRDRNGAEVSSGIYFYRLETPDKVVTRKMVMLK